MAIDLVQTGVMSSFATALVLVLRIAEKKLDKSRHGPLYPRVSELEDTVYGLDATVEHFKRKDLVRRLDRIEEQLREIARQNEA